MIKHFATRACLILAAFPGLLLAGTNISDVKCEYLENPLGIDVEKPRLSWVVQTEAQDWRQTAYQVLVASDAGLLEAGKADLWDSGKIESDQSTHLPYDGEQLESRDRCFWKVRVWGPDGKAGDWSNTAFWEMGLLDSSDWEASWISAPRVYDWVTFYPQYRTANRKDPVTVHEPAPYLRKSFSLDKPLQQARIHISGVGYYELYINGEKVGDRVLDPAFTDYDKRALYSTFDVTEQLQKGKNTVGVLLGDGWYNMHTRAIWAFTHAPWRDRAACVAQIEAIYEDGTTERIASDASWMAKPSPVIYNSIRGGEKYDARRELPNWCDPGLDDSDWTPVRPVAGPQGNLVAQKMEPIRVVRTVEPEAVVEAKPGVYVFHFPQNMAGWVKLKMQGKAGQRIKLKFGELLHKDGTVNQHNIDRHHREPEFHIAEYTFKGVGVEIWEPRFTYYGFQYVEVTGLKEAPALDSLEGRVVSTSFAQAGRFQCSNELINRIVHCSEWSFIGNFHGYPTDCPQREKNGWTGDAHLSAETGLLMFKPQAAYTKWLDDLNDAQRPNGQLPGIVPTNGWGYEFKEKHRRFGFGPAWDGAYTWLTWYLYLYSGDTGAMRKHYANLKSQIRFLTYHSEGQICSIGLGDWVFVNTMTPTGLTGTACYYDLTRKVAAMAGILGEHGDAKELNSLAERIKEAFNQKYYDPKTHLYSKGEQTALASALYFDLVPAGDGQLVADHLAKAIENNDGLLDCGVLGAKYIPHALSRYGYTDLMLKVVTDTRYPGWGHWIANGATTLWEDFNISSPLNSRNHTFFGDIAHWFYQELAGIRPDPENPGFKHFVLAPKTPRMLDWVAADYDSMYGKIVSRWKRIGERTEFTFEIPPNTSASIQLPAMDLKSFEINGTNLKNSGIRFRKEETLNQLVFELGAGSYKISGVVAATFAHKGAPPRRFAGP